MRRELPTASQGITEYDQKSIKDCFNNLDHRRRKHLTSDKNSGPNKVTLIENEQILPVARKQSASMRIIFS